MTDTVSIQALGQRGEGVATHNGAPVFVPFALPGETAEVVVDDDHATIVSLRNDHADRIAPFCPSFGACGGCALQHMGPTTYAAFKQNLVTTALRHRRIDVAVGPLLDARGDGRRRATLHTTRTAAGYMRTRSHELLDISACPILVPALHTAAPRIAREIGAIFGPCDVLATATDSGLDIAIRLTAKVKTDRLVGLAQRLRLTRLSLNGETIFQLAAPTLRMGRATVDLPPGSFLQATTAAEATLAGLVGDAVGNAGAVADLFCGLGPFALRLAERCRIAAFDSDKPATAALMKAAHHTRGLKAITATARDLFRDPLAPVELAGFDAVIIDPPRAGAEAQARELSKSKVPTVIAVSCDPRSFARDASILINGGYRLGRVTTVDQFAWSPHVEIVGVFKR